METQAMDGTLPTDADAERTTFEVLHRTTRGGLTGVDVPVHAAARARLRAGLARN